MPQIPESINLHIPEMKRAKEGKDAKDFMDAVIKAFEELDRYWSTLRSDIERAE